MDLKIPSTGQKRVVIIGGGFGGIEVAKHLSEKDVQIVFESGATLATVGSIAVKDEALFVCWLQQFGAEKFPVV